MQVHQTPQLVMGIMLGGSGLFILSGCFYECLKSKTLPPKTRQPLLSAILFIALGVGHLSQSFDWLHQESYRTSLIGYMSLPVVFIGLVLLSLLRRAEKGAKADMGITALGEHKV